MNRGAIISDLKKMIGPGIEVDDGGLATWVNDAYMYMVDEVAKANPEYFTDTATQFATPGRQEYDLPPDNEKIVMVNLQYDGVWRRPLPIPLIGNIRNLGDTASYQGYTVGNPGYYIFGDQIGFIPATAAETDTIKLWYVYTPEELSEDSDTPELPAKFHHIIKYGAYANYLDQDDEHAAAEAMRRRFEKRVQDMVDSLQDNQVDEPKSVTITQNTDMYYDEGDW
jgi:hypothetical protein